MKNNKSKKRYITLIIETQDINKRNVENSYSSLSKKMRDLRKEYQKIIIENRQQTVYGIDIFNEMKKIELELKKLVISIKPSFPPNRTIR